MGLLAWWLADLVVGLGWLSGLGLVAVYRLSGDFDVFALSEWFLVGCV